MEAHENGWITELGLFFLWGTAAVSVGVAIAGAFTIGIFVLPIAWALLGLSTWRTFRRPGRTHTLTGLLALPAFGIGYLGSWSTFTSDSPGDHCTTVSGVTTCESSVSCDATDHCVDTTPHTTGGGNTHFQWTHALPFITVGVAIALTAVALFLILGVRAHRRTLC